MTLGMENIMLRKWWILFITGKGKKSALDLLLEGK